MKRGLAAGCVAFACARSAAAQSENRFAADRFEPAERGSTWFATDSLDLRGRLRPSAGVVAASSYRSFVVRSADHSVIRSPVRNLVYAHLGASLVIADRVRIGANLPLQLFADGHTMAAGGALFPGPDDEQGVGDLRLAADVRVFGVHGGRITGAVGLQGWVPTGQTSQWASDGAARLRPRAMIAGAVGAFVYAAQLHVGYRERSLSFDGGAIGSELGLAASAGVRFWRERIVVGPELFGSTVFDAAFERTVTPVEALLGAHALLAPVRIGAGVGRGIGHGVGSPESRVILSVEWAPQPSEPIDRLPPPAPPAPAPPAPVTDGDGDGIPDASDACPRDAGIATAVATTNGCAPDSDGDGLDDLADACPTVPGIRSDDLSVTGCPDRDRDHDGIANDRDACPDEPGAPDPDPARSGCPVAFLAHGQINILDQVKFKLGSAEIVPGPESEAVLEAVRKILVAHPEVRSLSIEGHTDNAGAADRNRTLSAARAAAVLNWLVQHGIAKDRLSSAGFGAERPVANNETDFGRALNRRVEFRVKE